MSNSHNEHFTNSIQAKEQHIFFCSGNTYILYGRDVACRLQKQNWWTEAQ